ncbi:hypothetical protein IQ266_10500 [filamentous cyanobacterium LEGE 11480]|uniref:Uncharacterized protein n=1 Tax=Romeriopsis navalis LEGE 11480 TaxID=2777977 RepID=A0A928VQC0_9CYAN|nr:hypothetical protein [Romeriopsis navalis]MBE9030159.1 hypothetical protein [Romeriopsis navalis LEGE 11480]
MKQFALQRNLIILPLLSFSLLGASLPAMASPEAAIEDITSKLELCKGFDTPAERQECLNRVREYCLANYSPEFCKKVFKKFKQSQMDAPKQAKPAGRLD